MAAIKADSINDNNEAVKTIRACSDGFGSACCADETQAAVYLSIYLLVTEPLPSEAVGRSVGPAPCPLECSRTNEAGLP